MCFSKPTLWVVGHNGFPDQMHHQEVAAAKCNAGCITNPEEKVGEKVMEKSFTRTCSLFKYGNGMRIRT